MFLREKMGEQAEILELLTEKATAYVESSLVGTDPKGVWAKALKFVKKL